MHLAMRGRHAEALVEIDRAQELDPLSRIIGATSGMINYVARRDDQAIEQLRRTLELDPAYPIARVVLGWVYEAKGMLEEALEEHRRATALGGRDALSLASLARSCAVSGRRGEAAAILDSLERRAYVQPFFVAGAYIGLGDKERALEWLEKGYREYDAWILFVREMRWFDALQGDPRLARLLKRLGLE